MEHPDKQVRDLLRQAEAILPEMNALSLEQLETLPREEKQRMLHEFQRDQIALQIQNERLRQLERELQASKARYVDLYDLAPVGYCTVSRQGLILEANLTAASQWGVSRGTPAEKLMHQFIYSEDLAVYHRFQKDLFETGKQKSCELRMVKNGAAPFWARLESTAVQDADGAPIAHLVISDITGRKQADEELRAREQRLLFLLTSTPAVIYTSRAFGDFGATFVSENVQAQMGYPASEFVEDSAFWANHIHPEDVDRVFAEMIPSLTEDSHEHEYRFRHKDGTYRWMHDQVRLMRDAAGQPETMIGCWLDISARKQAEEALRSSEAKLREIIHASPAPMALNDDQQNIIFLNRAFVHTFGYTLEEIPTLADWWPKAYPDLEYRKWIAEAWKAELERTERTGGVFPPIEVSVKCKNGSYRTVLASASSFSNALDRNHLVILYDITERKLAQEAQATLQNRLQHSQKIESVGLLAGGVAHDFNNMLGVILGHTEMALDEMSPTDDLYEHLAAIQTAAERSANLTRQLLAFARKQTIAPRTLDLNQTVAAILPMLERLLGEGIRLLWCPEANLGHVKMDPSQLDQILTNLCVNARHAIADIGQVIIESENVRFDQDDCAAHPGTTPGEYVRLTVRDSGCGMDQETLLHIFEPFFTTRGAGEGVGLGLATVYGAVTQNNGAIAVSSSPGEGTTFDIFLPRHSGSFEPVQTEAAEESTEPGNETILVVEDEPAILHIVKTALEGQGFTVLSASRPDEALRIAKEHPGEIHLLLTDVVIPDMKITDLVDILLALYPSLKRLFMSGYTADIITRHGVLDEGLHFIQKPFSIINLVVKVRAVLHSETAVNLPGTLPSGSE